MALETFYFHHPVLNWIPRDVRNEREICCDKPALSVKGGSRREFAEALARLGEPRSRYSALLLAANGGILIERVQQLFVHPKGASRKVSTFYFRSSRRNPGYPDGQRRTK